MRVGRGPPSPAAHAAWALLTETQPSLLLDFLDAKSLVRFFEAGGTAGRKRLRALKTNFDAQLLVTDLVRDGEACDAVRAALARLEGHPFRIESANLSLSVWFGPGDLRVVDACGGYIRMLLRCAAEAVFSTAAPKFGFDASRSPFRRARGAAAVRGAPLSFPRLKNYSAEENAAAFAAATEEARAACRAIEGRRDYEKPAEHAFLALETLRGPSGGALLPGHAEAAPGGGPEVQAPIPFLSP
ncbi:hypothetical protein JKP88DRAFT_286321 [Tribonema minus]|uniref:Uncharacterized protein n=1 Tax=Tribonema minus TaxID=303371 RepID=A0A836CLR9_9STRA|nr:hypothetical protein JKP88DRAFT_286321 [Tribonema minus]